jgi:hypothetical protein
MLFGLVPTMNALTVVYARGGQAYRSGIRVAPIKPPQFTDGLPVPSDAAVKAIFTSGGILVLYTIVPPLLFPIFHMGTRPRTEPADAVDRTGG